MAELGGEHDLVPAALQDLSQGEFGRALAAVGLGGVEERDALVNGGVDDRPGLLDIETAAEVIAAEAYYRDEQAGVTQGSIAHGSASYARRPAGSLSGNDYDSPENIPRNCLRPPLSVSALAAQRG